MGIDDMNGFEQNDVAAGQILSLDQLRNGTTPAAADSATVPPGQAATQPDVEVDGSANGQLQTPEAGTVAEVRTRSYQQEMLDYSLRGNIICTMDTGSGKTHIAVLRIREELLKSHHKISWFLTPTVTLLHQQYQLLDISLPCPVIPLDGDVIEKWSKRRWGEILDKIKNGVVVSTHQVLRDALAHGFVKFGDVGSGEAKSIGLIIFDEAHHCVGNHPAKKIMDEFYKPRLEGREVVLPRDVANMNAQDKIVALGLPAILGLTASPLIRARPQDLNTIEHNLCAIARTPKIHKAELLKYVHPPELKQVTFKPYSGARFIEVLQPPSALSIPTSPSTPVPITSPVSPPRKRKGVTKSYQSPQKQTTITTFSLDDLRSMILPSDLAAKSNDNIMDIDKEVAEAPVIMEPFIESPALAALEAARASLNILEDPYVIYLRRTKQLNKLSEILIQRDTDTQTEMKTFVQRAQYLNNDFGVWSAEYFIAFCINKFMNMYFPEKAQHYLDAETEDYYPLGGYALNEMDDTEADERRYLANILQTIPLQDIRSPAFLDSITQPGMLTPKVELLMKELRSELEHEETKALDFSGLIFVEQRVGAAMLSTILSTHPSTRSSFRPRVLIGSSSGMKNRNRNLIGNLMTPVHEFSILEKFREGQCNLLIATSVAEEGIDIQACAVVLCFNLPPNLKSFIQRRGRARRKGSRCTLMYPESESKSKLKEWESLEVMMKQVYENDMRALEEEDKMDDQYEEGDMRFSTSRALLTMESAIPKLNHFCSVLPKDSYVDTRPVFDVSKEEDGHLRCTVSLPTSIDPQVRKHETTVVWRTPKCAKQEAAFQACIELYKFGLLDEHLLPLNREDEDEEKRMALAGVEARPSKVTVDPLMEPWFFPWDESASEIWETTIQIQHWTWYLYTPFKLPDRIPDHPLYISSTETFSVSIGTSSRQTIKTIVERYGSLDNARSFCQHWFWSIYSTRMNPDPTKLDFPYVFVPKNMDLEDKIRGRERFEPYDMWVLDLDDLEQNNFGIIRDSLANGKPYLFVKLHTGDKAEELAAEMLLDNMKYGNKSVEPGQAVLEVRPLPLRRDLLHMDRNWENPEILVSKKMRNAFLFPQFCKVDDLHYSITRQAIAAPSIIREIGLAIIADDMRANFLASCNLGVETLPLVKQALCHSAAREGSNYERLEFIGDCTLKFLAAIQVAGEYPRWHEGLLTAKKDRTVANSRLARSAVEKKLSRWIIDQAFTGSKWKPHYLSDTAADIVRPTMAEVTRNLSTKVLADVIEALIGVCYLVGGFNKALDCIALFDLDLPIKPLQTRNQTLYDSYPILEGPPPNFVTSIEKMIGYQFSKRSILMEAMTHPSYENEHAAGMSYQRLEFIGDAVLDMIIVDEIFNNGHTYAGKEYSHVDLHLYKSAAVNADMLAHLCLSLVDTHELPDVLRMSELAKRHTMNGDEDADGMARKVKEVSFASCLLHHSQALARGKQESKIRHDALKADIERAIDPPPETLIDEFGAAVRTPYPWVQLAAVEADKFLSDMVESTIGAVYVDSLGDLGVVRKVIEKFGVLRVLGNLLRKNVDPSHPVKKLGELAGKDLKKVAYDIQQEIQTNRFGKPEFSCVVWVGEVAVARVNKGSSRTEVRTRAAEVAWMKLKGAGSQESDQPEVVGNEDEEEEKELYERPQDVEEEQGGVRLDGEQQDSVMMDCDSGVTLAV